MTEGIPGLETHPWDKPIAESHALLENFLGALANKPVKFANTQDADAHIEELRTQRLNALHFHQPVNAPAAYRYEGPKQGCPYCRDREGGC